MEIRPIRTGNDFLNLTMAVKRGVSYFQLKEIGYSQQDILAIKKAILYIEKCYKNILREEGK